MRDALLVNKTVSRRIVDGYSTSVVASSKAFPAAERGVSCIARLHRMDSAPNMDTYAVVLPPAPVLFLSRIL
jgi:hypothetical protein